MDSTTLETEKRDHQLIITIRSDSEIIGYIVIDSLVGGTSFGGLRMLPDIDEKEMRLLAHSMSIKFAFLGFAKGGAKAGIVGDPETTQEKKQHRLLQFGRAAYPLLQNRIYQPGTDMGTDVDDIRFMLKALGLPIAPRDLNGSDSGLYTAMSVCASAAAAASHINLPLTGVRVAVEGFGKVGRPLARLLENEGATVVAVSTSHGAIYRWDGLDVAQLETFADRWGSRFVAHYHDAEKLKVADLVKLPVDILCPCARHHTISEQDADCIKARIISPGANNPITPAALNRLVQNNVICIPDYIANCGGVLGGTMAFASVPGQEIARLIKKTLHRRVIDLLRHAERHHCSLSLVAEHFVREKMQQIQSRGNQRIIWRVLFRGGIELYRQGLIPRSWMARLAKPYFKWMMAQPVRS